MQELYGTQDRMKRMVWYGRSALKIIVKSLNREFCNDKSIINLK